VLKVGQLIKRTTGYNSSNLVADYIRSAVPSISLILLV